MILPRLDHSRKTRSSVDVFCPKKYCTGEPEGELLAQCSRRKCIDGRSLPSCWFALSRKKRLSMEQRKRNEGRGTTTYFADEQRDKQHYLHHTNSHLSCLPCCAKNSLISSMPSKTIENS